MSISGRTLDRLTLPWHSRLSENHGFMERRNFFWLGSLTPRRPSHVCSALACNKFTREVKRNHHTHSCRFTAVKI